MRDVLWIDDLLKAFEAAVEKIDVAAGRVFNVGGGVDYQLSLLETLGLLERYTNRKLDVSFADWRPGDQPIYVSDTARIRTELNWSPTVDPEIGIQRLVEWVSENRPLFR